MRIDIFNLKSQIDKWKK